MSDHGRSEIQIPHFPHISPGNVMQPGDDLLSLSGFTDTLQVLECEKRGGGGLHCSLMQSIRQSASWPRMRCKGYPKASGYSRRRQQQSMLMPAGAHLHSRAHILYLSSKVETSTGIQVFALLPVTDNEGLYLTCVSGQCCKINTYSTTRVCTC